MRAKDVLEEGLRKKQALAEEARGRGFEYFEKLSRNEHALRPPRPCGMTVHPSYGCRYSCTYCYVKPIPGEGVRLLELSGYELALVLSLNPYFLPGTWGTLVAIGSITEPFLDERLTSKTVEVMEGIERLLGNPQQVSTKSVLSDDLLAELGRRGDRRLSFLISVTTVSLSRVIEPGAPPPEERIAQARSALAHGLRPALFVRPILPVLTERDFGPMLELAKGAGARDVVLGTLEVNADTLRKLEKVLPAEAVCELRKRLPGELDASSLKPIRGSDIKRRLWLEATQGGFRVHMTACSANVTAHGQACSMCDLGPCGDERLLPIVKDPKDLLELLDISAVNAWITGDEKLVVETRKTPPRPRVELLRACMRRRVVFTAR